MHPLTIFLAKLIGLSCVLLAAAMLANRRSALAAIDGLIRNASLLLLTGVVFLPAGLALVLGHTIWRGGALAVAVTLFGWATLIKAFALVAVPQDGMRRFYQALHYDRWFTALMAATLVAGLVLTLAGFAA